MTRSQYWDEVRGFGMLVVIFAHALLYFDSLKFQHPMLWVFSTFEMVLFFYVSGYVAGLSTRTRGFVETVRHKAAALVVPYVIFAVIAWALFREWTFAHYFFNIGLWFLRILFFVFVLHAASQTLAGRLSRGTPSLRISLLCSAGAVLIGYSLSLIPNTMFFRTLGYFTLWFECGFYLSRLHTFNLSSRCPRYLTFFAVFLGFAALAVPLTMGSAALRRLCIPPMAVLGVLTVLSFVRVLDGEMIRPARWIGRFLAYTGRNSLAFYIVHVFVGHATGVLWPVAEGSRFAFTRSVGAFFDPTTHQFLLTVLMTAAWYLISMALIEAYHRIIKHFS